MTTHLYRTFFVSVLLLVTASAQQDEVAADTVRLIEALKAGPGSVVADIGAGPEALVAIPMARHVGPSGRVYATDLGQKSVQLLTETIKKSGLNNVEIIEGAGSATNLPDRCCDGIFIRFVYHHFGDPPVMNASLRKALKPGGRLAVMDFLPRGAEAADPGGRGAGDQHGVTPETVAKELLAAGFELVSADPRSAKRDVFLVVVQNPQAP
jgi:ubiquinone/menaquinone biosynthesis C-methylase UbiE